jgi:uncharacterized membrane protein
MPGKKTSEKVAKKERTLKSVMPWLLLVFGVIGLLASISLSTEVFDRLKNPNYVPVCNLNPILSCTTVADSNQAEAFGFPNYYIGIAGFASMATIGFGMLAGAKYKRWFWLCLQAGVTFGVFFVSWLQFQSIYRIGALCIFCMIVWAVTIPAFWYTTLYNFRESHIRVRGQWEKFIDFLQRHHGDVLIAWYLVIILLILKRFWYYWSTLF